MLKRPAARRPGLAGAVLLAGTYVLLGVALVGYVVAMLALAFLAVLVATLRLVFTPVLERLPGRRVPARSLKG